MVLVHVLDRARLGREHVAAFADVADELVGPEIDDAAEAGDEMGRADGEFAEAEIGEMGVGRRFLVAGQERRRTAGSGSRSPTSPTSVSRAPASGSPDSPPGSTRRSEARLSRSRFWVWTARRERRRIGSPAGVVATVTSEAKGLPSALSVASDPTGASGGRAARQDAVKTCRTRPLNTPHAEPPPEKLQPSVIVSLLQHDAR